MKDANVHVMSRHVLIQIQTEEVRPEQGTACKSNDNQLQLSASYTEILSKEYVLNYFIFQLYQVKWTRTS